MPEELPAHSNFGGSNADRYINCAGSINAIAALPERDRNPDNVFADEGTAAHGLGETCLKEGTDPEEYRGTHVPGKMYVNNVLQTYLVNDDMIDAIQIYVDCVRGHMERLGPTAVLYVEPRVFPILEDSRFYGHADAIIVEEFIHCEMVVVDFKYGHGIVEVIQNPQAKFYGLGGLRQAPDVLNVLNVIVQPRAAHRDGLVRSEKLPSDELREFAGVLIGAAELTEDPNAPRKAGKWCKWCPARGVCPTLNAQNLDVCRADFKDIIAAARAGQLPDPSAIVDLPDPNDLKTLSRAWLGLPYLDYIQSGVTGMVQRLVEQGLDFEFAKLVHKRSTRKWLEEDEEQLELDMINAVRRAEAQHKIKIGRSAIYEPRKLKSPAGLDSYSYRAEGQKRGKCVLKPFVKKACEKRLGGLTLVRMDDSREAVPQKTLAETFAKQIAAEKERQRLQAGENASGEETQ